MDDLTSEQCKAHPWPAGCHDPNSCYRHKQCKYAGCRYGELEKGMLPKLMREAYEYRERSQAKNSQRQLMEDATETASASLRTWQPEIEATHPMEDLAGQQEIEADELAMQLVGERHAKRDLVDLVRWLILGAPGCGPGLIASTRAKKGRPVEHVESLELPDAFAKIASWTHCQAQMNDHVGQGVFKRLELNGDGENEFLVMDLTDLDTNEILTIRCSEFHNESAVILNGRTLVFTDMDGDALLIYLDE